MALPVRLKDVVDEMDAIGDDNVAYIHRKTGELVGLTSEAMSLAEDEDEDGDGDSSSFRGWPEEMIDQARQVIDDRDYIALPDRFEINEYRIMERYCGTIEDEQARRALLKAINGKGAFRRFKDEIYELEIEQDWYRFRDSAFKQIAADFLAREGIAFVDD